MDKRLLEETQKNLALEQQSRNAFISKSGELIRKIESTMEKMESTIFNKKDNKSRAKK